MPLPYRLQRDWTFRVEHLRPYHRRFWLNFVTGLRRAPPTRVLRAATPAPRWAIWFVYAPDGTVGAAHRFTLDRLKALDRKLLIVCASPDGRVPPELSVAADALIWKGLSGYDFSAYAAGLRHLARRSPHADVLVLNDSIYGPFVDLEPLIERARWDLTGFTSSTHQENHLQSYAFLLRDITPTRLRDLWSVFVPGLAFNDIVGVIDYQELRLARVASGHMSVGALWHAPDLDNSDPTLFTAEALLDQGFPFIKKSTLGKKRTLIGEDMAARIETRLAVLGHPSI